MIPRGNECLVCSYTALVLSDWSCFVSREFVLVRVDVIPEPLTGGNQLSTAGWIGLTRLKKIIFEICTLESNDSLLALKIHWIMNR